MLSLQDKYINTTTSGYTKMFQRLWGNIAQRPIKKSLVVNLKSSPRKLYGRHHDLVKNYRATNDHGYNHNLVLCPFMIYPQVCDKTNITGATCEAGAAYHSGSPEFTLGF